MACNHLCHCESYREHLASLSFRSGGPDVEKQWSKDHAAYRRLVADGVQPRRLDGAAEIEQRAESKVEIETDHYFDKPSQRRVAEEVKAELS